MNELQFLDSLFNCILDDADYSSSYSTKLFEPPVDVMEKETGYTLEMELPGCNENDVEIEVEQNNLTISSKQEAKKEMKKDANTKEKWLLRERNYRGGNFCRRFALPKDVDAENISASFANGVLTVNLQKKAVEAPKKITIKMAS